MTTNTVRKIPFFLNFAVSESFVLFVIFLNACVFIILDINPQVGVDYPLLYQLDIVCILFFILEAFIKIYTIGYRNYFSDNWNRFDSLIVISSLPILLEPIMPSLASNLTWTPILRMTRVLRLAKFLRLGRIIRYAGRDGALSQIRIPIYLILLIVTSNFLLGLVTLPEHIQGFIKIIYAPSLILAVTSIVSKVSLLMQEVYLNPIITKDYGVSSEVIIGFGRTGFVLVLWFIGIIVAIEMAGFNSFSLIAGLGIGSLAVAFAAQDALGNILAGISLLVQKHFVVGDYLKIADNEGFQEIGADYLIIGSITEFGRKNVGESKVFSRSKTQIVEAGISIRLIDVSTGQIIYSEEAKGQAETSNKTTLGLGKRTDYDSSLSDKAISAAISQLVENIINNCLNRPWKSYFLSYDQD